MNQREMLEKARERVIESIAKNMDLYGVTPSVGRLYGIMYFHDGPMTLDQMGDALGMSKTSMSTGVRQLMELGMVEKVWMRGNRKDNYQVEEDWYKTFVDFFCIKWRKGIEMNKAAISRSMAELREIAADPGAEKEIREMAHRDLDKLTEAMRYYDWLTRLVNRFESGEIFDWLPKPASAEQADLGERASQEI